MRAIVLDAGKLALRERPTPAPAAGDVLLEVSLAGICGTDLELLRGYYDFHGVPGHEFVARVVHPGASGLAPGQRVVSEINVSCGRCAMCQRGLRTHCERRDVIGIRDRDGAFAELTSAPAANLHAVPDGVSDEQAVFVEPLAAALQIPDQVEVAPGMRVLVVGAGRLGQLVARVLALHAVDLQVVTRHERHRACLAEAGVDAIEATDVEPGEADLVIDATGHESGLRLALSALRPRGTLVMKSTFAGDVALPLARFVVDELTLVGSRCGSFDQALEAIGTGQIDPAPLVDACYPLAEYEAAYAHAARPGALKVLLDPHGQGGADAR